MPYIATENITVFPSVKRVNTEVNSRLITEKSLVSLVNKLIDQDGFIISVPTYSGGSLVTSNPFEFNIHGYYFKVSSLEELIDAVEGETGTTIYGSIILQQVGEFEELTGQDIDSEYQGLVVGPSVPAPGTNQVVYSLPLLVRPQTTGGGWDVVKNSFFKFNKDSLNISIDGGNVE